MTRQESDHPHRNMPALTAGVPLSEADIVMIMLHGRGATARDILLLANEFHGDKVHYLAPQAARNSWYPYRFIENLEKNEPWLSSALIVVDSIIANVWEKGFSREKIILLGFSQGACLALEYAVRHARRYGAVTGLSGGLIGPPGTAWSYDGTLSGTPVFLGGDEADFHIPQERVVETTEVMKTMGAEMKVHFYKNLGHSINRDEIKQVQGILERVAASNGAHIK
jgi:predicted esterase